MKIIKFIKDNWTDPVWSKVFATGIVALISSIILFIRSLIKEIPINNIWNDSLQYLKGNTIQISYLTIVVVIILALIIIIPMISLKIISFQLKNAKVSTKLKTSDFDIEKYFNGTWKCAYTRVIDKWKGSEITEIKEGNKYYIANKLIFVLTDIEYLPNSKTICWTKTTFPNNTKHSKETLNIISDSLLSGTDDTGFEITYSKHL